MADRLKTRLLPDVDLMLDANDPDVPKMITGADYRRALEQAAGQPFRVRPYSIREYGAANGFGNSWRSRRRRPTWPGASTACRRKTGWD